MADKKHRILVVGTGSIGERHSRCLLATGRAAVAICEPNDTVRESVSSRYDLAGSYANLDEALSQSWDAALIATPAHTHIPIAQKVVNHSIPVLIEKPLATTLEGVDALIDSVNQRQLLAAVSYNYRAHPALADMKSALDSGRFGAIRQIYAITGQSFATYRPAYRDIYFADPAQGGGAIQDGLTHLVNIGEWLAGPADRILADAAHRALEGVSVEDTVHLIARHGDVPASYILNLYQHPNETSVTVVCEHGTARFEVQTQRWRWMNNVDGAWHDESFPLPERDTWYIINANAFLNALEGSAPALCSLAEGVQTLHTMLAALRAVNAPAWQSVVTGATAS